MNRFAAFGRNKATHSLAVKALNGGDYKHFKRRSSARFSVQCSFARGTLYGYDGSSLLEQHRCWNRHIAPRDSGELRQARSRYLREYVLVVRGGWKGLFLLCLLIPSSKCIIFRIECTDDLLTVFTIFKAPGPICQKLLAIASALIPYSFFFFHFLFTLSTLFFSTNVN